MHKLKCIEYQKINNFHKKNVLFSMLQNLEYLNIIRTNRRLEKTFSLITVYYIR